MRENVNHRQQIESLQKEIKQHQQAIDNCRHGEWSEPKYDPEEYREGYGSKQVGKGSDPWWEPEGYVTKQRDRWSRECKCCGKIEYTYTQEPVIVGHKPSFK